MLQDNKKGLTKGYFHSKKSLSDCFFNSHRPKNAVANRLCGTVADLLEHSDCNMESTSSSLVQDCYSVRH